VKDDLEASKIAYSESQSILAITREELASANRSLQAPIRITSQEEGKQMIRAGLQAVKSLELVKRQFQEFKVKYANSVPAKEVANYAALNEKLKHAVKLAQDKEKELTNFEESVEGV
jgi:hypothetical protein